MGRNPRGRPTRTVRTTCVAQLRWGVAHNVACGQLTLPPTRCAGRPWRLPERGGEA
jgi:hypothetical protein